MSNAQILIERNKKFSENYSGAELPIVPKLRTVIITCGDARVDPAHIMGVELGESVVIRNNGGRVTQAVVEELAAMTFMVAKMDGDTPKPFEVVIIQHTQCGAERFADPSFQAVLKEKVGIDVSRTAIHDHDESVKDDIAVLRNAEEIPGYVIVSGYVYDVNNGSVREVAPPTRLK